MKNELVPHIFGISIAGNIFNITKWDENRLERYHIVILVVLLWFFIPDSLLIDLGKLDDAERYRTKAVFDCSRPMKNSPVSNHPQPRLQRTHFFWNRFSDAFDQNTGDRMPDKIFAGYPDDFTCRFGDGKRAYQFFLLFA